MSYTYLLAGENLELAEAELQGFLRSQGIDEDVSRTGKLAETEVEPSQLKRLALTHEVCRVIEKGKLEEPEPGYSPEKTYAVRAVDVLDRGYETRNFEREVGKVLEGEENSVDLESPEEVVKLYLLEDSYILARQVEDIDRGLFEKRKNQERPFSSPVSLDPVTARVLVNLSEVAAGGHLLDPFCGTGGMLIEAGLCGIGVHGLDVQEEMVEGARENLEEYGIIIHDIRQGDINDISQIFDRRFDAVVTDLPYGKASKTEGSPVKDFLELAPEMTDGKIVFMSDQEEIDGLEPEHEIYVHKNLTRFIYII